MDGTSAHDREARSDIDRRSQDDAVVVRRGEMDALLARMHALVQLVGRVHSTTRVFVCTDTTSDCAWLQQMLAGHTVVFQTTATHVCSAAFDTQPDDVCFQFTNGGTAAITFGSGTTVVVRLQPGERTRIFRHKGIWISV